MAQAVHAAFEHFAARPHTTKKWLDESNYLVVVAVPNEGRLSHLVAEAELRGITTTCVREPDLDNTLCAVALEPGDAARRLCSSFPLALKEPAMA